MGLMEEKERARRVTVEKKGDTYIGQPKTGSWRHQVKPARQENLANFDAEYDEL